LKKASPDLPPPPSHHLDDLTESFTDDHSLLRWSTEAPSLHEKGKTVLLEMSGSNLLPCHNSCHWRRSRLIRIW
jgi:hypothetical protein